MSGYTATDWTITIYDNERITKGGHQPRPKKFVTAKLVLPTGGQVPAAGVPLPGTRLGFVNTPRYILHGDVDTSFSTATARCIHWVYNATAERLKAYRYTVASMTATSIGGRAIRSFATTVTLDTSHSIFVTAEGW